jgi:N-acetylglucosamine kinase-like BadF-type ATPase
VNEGEKSIVCILGTGSNCSYYDGSDIIQKVISLGYILMDDASGNYFGRQLIRDYHFNRIPKDLAIIFEASFDLSSESVKNHLYKNPNPNTYLATFARFLIENKNHDYCQSLIQRGLIEFVECQILQFEDAHEIPIHFVGSIAFYLEKELEAVLEHYQLKLGKVLKRPIEGLVAHHKSYILH